MHKNILLSSLVVISLGFSPIISLAAPKAPVPQTESSATPDIQRLEPLPGYIAPIVNTTPTITTSPLKLLSPLTTTSLTTQTAQTTETIGPNLIANPGVEATGTSSGVPQGWAKGGYGTNTRVLSYPVPGYTGTKAIQVKISAYTNGDAKWYFTDVPVTAGHTYQFSDYYTSGIQSLLTVRYTLTDGTFIYTDLQTVPSASTWTQTSVRFTIPNNVVSLTMFHLIEGIGTLVTDEHSLNEITQTTVPPPPDPTPTSTPTTTTSLIPNGDFETAGTGNNPQNWSRGRWGTNTAVFTYPTTGVNGSKGAKVSLTSYSSGDAKWYFTPITVSPGLYTFTDQYTSNIPSTITVQFQSTSGAYTYKDILSLPAASSFTNASAVFTVPTGTANVTIFHLIEAVGALTIDNAAVYPNTGKGIFSTGAVTFSFDDGWLSQKTDALPKLISAGFKGTFYIVTHQMADQGFAGFMSTADVKTLYADGEEIGAHTQTHPHLTTLSSAQQSAEIFGSQTDLINMNVGPITSFAYPYGEYNQTTLGLLRGSSLQNARATINGRVNMATDPYQLNRYSGEITSTLAEVKQQVDAAIAEKSWLILTFHRIDTSGDQYSISPTLFNQIVDYVAQKNIPVVTVSQGVADMQ